MAGIYHTPHQHALPPNCASEIYDFVGGRILHLMRFKRDLEDGDDFSTIRDKMILETKTKFIGLENHKEAWKLLDILLQQGGNDCEVSTVLTLISKKTIDECLNRDILRLYHRQNGVIIEFESRLSEAIAQKHMFSNST